MFAAIIRTSLLFLYLQFSYLYSSSRFYQTSTKLLMLIINSTWEIHFKLYFQLVSVFENVRVTAYRNIV